MGLVEQAARDCSPCWSPLCRYALRIPASNWGESIPERSLSSQSLWPTPGPLWSLMTWRPEGKPIDWGFPRSVVLAFAGAFGGKSTTPVNGYQHRLKRSTCSSAKSPTLSASAPSGTKSSIKVSALLSRPSRLFLAVSRSLLA